MSSNITQFKQFPKKNLPVNLIEFIKNKLNQDVNFIDNIENNCKSRAYIKKYIKESNIINKFIELLSTKKITEGKYINIIPKIPFIIIRPKYNIITIEQYKEYLINNILDDNNLNDLINNFIKNKGKLKQTRDEIIKNENNILSNRTLTLEQQNNELKHQLENIQKDLSLLQIKCNQEIIKKDNFIQEQKLIITKQIQDINTSQIKIDTLTNIIELLKK